MTTNPKNRVRYVILHKPGPKWQRGVDFREQNGVQEHVNHYRAVLQAGQLALGGPFLAPDMGGMMLPVETLTEDEVRRIAESDPAIKSGLLEFEIRPWYVAMNQEA